MIELLDTPSQITGFMKEELTSALSFKGREFPATNSMSGRDI